MKVASYLFREGLLTENTELSDICKSNCTLVLSFGGKEQIADPSLYIMLREMFPVAEIAMCSTAGEIFGSEVFDNSVSIIAVEFERTPVRSVSVNISSFESSYKAGASLMERLDSNQLKYVLVLSDGNLVNGSELVRGVESVVPESVLVTGGLAGDGTNFSSTIVGLNQSPAEGNIIAIGLYGDSISISQGSRGGWETFGLERTITRSSGNELFEIDNKNALELYKQYLGHYAEDLPGSALLFPLSLTVDGEEAVVRTILSINNESSSMVFAGDVPEGARIKFMRATFDNLIEAASNAAKQAVNNNSNHPKLGLLISCVGRKIVLDKRTDEEVEAVKDVFGNSTVVTGFYSYGEIAPANRGRSCLLHNQTMTITVFDELV